MDSWTLQGDSYSFLRSAPRTFSLCHREGTPNHVEIFDIINVPTQRSAISETTCLCDIFGDNCESPSLSSSPAVGTFVPSQREIDETAAASPLVDELNDSSSSYHTAQGSSEGEEGCEDSRERVCSPLFQNVPSERKHSEGVQLDIYADTSNNCEPKSNSPVPELNTANPSPGGLDSSVRTPSPGHNSPNTLSSEGRVSSLSSSSLEKRLSPSSPYPRPVDSETESREITPSFPQRYNSPLHESLTPSTSSESRNYDHPSSPHSMKSSPEFMVAEVSPEPRSYFNQHDGPLSEPTFNNFSIDCTEPAFDSRAIKPSPEPSPTCSVLSSQSKETLLSPELKNRPDSPDTQPSSPFPEQGGRISLPDLFSRGSSPDIEDVPCSPELISAPSPEGRDCSPTTENAPLTPEPVRTVSTPSPAISTATSSELVQSSVSPILRHKTPSPGLFSAASSCTTGTRTPSPKITHISISSEIRTLVPSPVTSYSLTQSPEVRSSCSPKGCIYTAPSPEIRVTGSSPDMSRRDQTSEADTMSASPPLETHFDSFSSRSPTSSPHITGISYTVVQPEDRDTPLFPELSHLSSPEGRITTPNRDIIEGSIAESAGASQNSPHASGSTHSEITLTHPTRYQTPSPQAKHHTPSPESTYNTPLCKTYQSPSPEHMSGDLSPIVSPEQRFYQHSPTSSSTEYNLQYMQPNVHPRHTPESDRDVFAVDLTEIQNPDNNSPSYELDSNGKSVVTEIKISSPVQAIQSPVSISPFTSEVKEDSSHKQLSQEREATLTEVQKKSSLPLFPETEQDTSFNQKDIYKKSFDVKCTSPDCIVVKDKNINTSPVNRAMSSSPVQEIIQPYCVTSEMSSLSKSTCASKQQRRQFSNNDRSENRERFIDNMTHHVNKRRTPSPPLTRFTPVHILAPEKPYRQWQNRSHSSSQVVAFSPSGKLKKDVTNRESPSAPGDSNSHDHWVRLGRQLDMEQKMQLEDEREVHRERQGDREIDRERKREEQVPEKGGVRRGDTSYRGEQVELSFNARNRKGPVSRNTAPTSREILLGLPAVHSYSESLPATRQLQQQQNLLRLASQQDTRVGGPGRGLKPSASQNKKSSPGNVAASRPCRSSSSSMGSELDEADNEVKWFTDVAFRSLSSPEVDYLDMYNSSHRSSTNISQPSTEESPAGVSASLLAYADFRGSAPKLDNDELSFQQPTAHYSDGLDPSRRYEMGSFECVDVAIEREDFRKVRRGVPKRQIQLKRRNANTEGKQDESSEKSSPGVPRTQGSPSPGSQSMEKFTRQHSTPAAMQDCYQSVENLEPTLQNERKSKLQKSLSLDETGSKTKMATCLIKSVLSKKMQNVDKQTDEQTGEEESPDFEQKSPSAVAPLKDSSKRDVCNDVSHLRGESRTMGETKPGKGFGVRSSSRPSSSSSSKSVTFSHTGSEEADSQDTNATSLKSEVRSELKVPFDIQTSRAEVQLADDHKLWDKREAGDSANATPQNTGVPFNIEARQQIITTDQECQNAEGRKQLQRDEYKSKTQETASKTVEKKKTSLNVCLTPEAENKPEASSANVLFTEKEDTTEISSDKTEEEEEGNGTIKAKVPIHKVRDVRRIVKNTYNLSFKATTAASPEVNEEKMENCNVEKNLETKKERQNGILKGEEKELSQEMWREEREEKKEEMKVEKKEEQREVVEHITPPPPLQSKGKTSSHPQPIQIEYKAVCKKESAYLSDKTQASPELVTELSRGSQQSSNATIQNYTTQDAGIANVAGGTESAPEICKVPGTRDKSVVIRTDRKPPMLGSLPRVPSKEREVSTAVVIIRDGSSKTKTASSLSQEDATAPFQAAAVSPIPGPNSTGCAPSNSGHSVSMLLKEKGYHADIGAVMGDGQSVAGRKAVLPKHVNSLEIPLQIAGPAEGGQVESHRQRTFSSSSNMSDNTDTLSKTREGSKPAVKETSKQKRASPLRNVHEQAPPMAKQKELGDFEAVKRLDPTFPPRSPALRRFKPQPIEVKSLSKETQKDEMPSPGNTRPQTIEVKSIAKNSQKPTVPPKPTCKFKPSDLGVTASEGQRPPATSSVSVKPQDEERSQTIVVSSPTIYRKISNESLSTPNYTRKLAVSAVSSLKPPPSKTTATTVSSLSKQSPGPSETEACIGRGEQQQVAASPQSSRNTQRLPTSPTAPTSVTDPGASINSVQATVSDATANQVPGPAAATACQPSQSAVMDADNQQQYTRTARPQEQAMPATSNNTKQVPGYTQQSSCRSLSSERPQRSDDLHFYTSDDPPSYDERESFSPLILPDLTPRRSTRYQPSSSPPPCSCTASRPSHPGVTPPHHHRSPHEPTPPVPTHSPGQALPYPMAQPPLRPHQCRPDHQPISYQHVSPKSLPLGPGHPPTLYPPLHQPPPCPPHPSLLQTCPADRPLQPAQHIDPRRPPVHRSPQQQLPVMAGTHYNDPGHSHSPGLPPMDPQYLCGPSTLGPAYGSEYGGDSSSLYSEGSYGQTPRRVLMDPETGKYFYIEMPVQPLRKMLFDPETGQYVEVLIPQQAVSHSGLYPPAAAPYPSLHNPSMYASAPQYMPYAAPPPPAHPQSQPQPPRYPEAPATATMHASGSGISFRNPSGQGSKPEPQNHPPLDQSYLESMYYVPTGMNASPNPTPPDYYHKRPPNLPPAGGKRS